MVVLALLILVGIAVVVLARSQRSPSEFSSADTAVAVRVGGLIAVVRLGVYWGGLALYTGNSDWRQVAGYALLIVNSIPELAIAAALSGNRPGPSLLVAGLIVLTSAALGWAIARIRARQS